MILVAVDPGIRGCGVATFNEGKLVRAAYVKSHAKTGNGPGACRGMANAVRDWLGPAAGTLVFEWPRVYASRIRAGQTKTDPNDLLALCGVDGALAALYPYATAECYAPSDWKGQIPKPKTGDPYIVETRIRSRLDLTETAAAEAGAVPASLAHNVWDAIGIGLHHLKRGIV